MGLAGAAVPDGGDVLAALDVLAAGQFHDQGLVHRGDDATIEELIGAGYLLHTRMGQAKTYTVTEAGIQWVSALDND